MENSADKREESLDRAVMNELNIGVDIIEIARFRRLDYSRNKRFYERTFTLKEIEHCLSFGDPAPHFAANFAGKEAVYKAVNGFRDVRLSWIEILRDKAGAPHVNILLNHKEAAKFRSQQKNPAFKIKVSLSHSALHAVAFALASYSGRAAKKFNLRMENSVYT